MKKCFNCKSKVSKGIIVDFPERKVVCCESKDCLWKLADIASTYATDIRGKEFENDR